MTTAMEALTTHAVYENGTLRPVTPLPLQDQEKVLLKVVRHCAVRETQGLLQGLDPAVVEVVEGANSPPSPKDPVTLPSGTHIFIDANILIYHYHPRPTNCRVYRISPESRSGRPPRNYLSRCSRRSCSPTVFVGEESLLKDRF